MNDEVSWPLHKLIFPLRKTRHLTPKSIHRSLGFRRYIDPYLQNIIYPGQFLEDIGRYTAKVF